VASKGGWRRTHGGQFGRPKRKFARYCDALWFVLGKHGACSQYSVYRCDRGDVSGTVGDPHWHHGRARQT